MRRTEGAIVVVMDGREEARALLGRGVVVAIATFFAFAVMIRLGALSNVFSATVMTTLGVIAFQVSITDTIAGVCGLLWARRKHPLVTLPQARVIGPS